MAYQEGDFHRTAFEPIRPKEQRLKLTLRAARKLSEEGVSRACTIAGACLSAFPALDLSLCW
jgi:hypothetical protein